MKFLILLLLIVLLWNISKGAKLGGATGARAPRLKKCDCGTFSEPTPKDRRFRMAFSYPFHGIFFSELVKKKFRETQIIFLFRTRQITN